MAGPTDVIIAGTKPFALALFAPVTERAGTRPRIAPEPSAALTLCGDSTGVLVLEYEPRWLPALTQLRQQRPSLHVVAALPVGQEDAAPSLGRLFIEAVPWAGVAGAMMPAIERALGGSRAGAAPGAAVPAASSPAAPAELDLFDDLGGAAALQPVSSPARAAPAPASPATPPALDLFADLGATAATPVPATLPAPGRAARPGEGAWPASGPSAAEAESALRDALSGAASLSPLLAVTEQVVAGLSPLERLVFTGRASPVDAGVIRRAAVLRLRTAAAMAARPAPGSPVDGEAVAELLSEIDTLLGAVKGLLDAAPLEAQVSLEAIRNALVKEAVDFSEACHALGAVEVPATTVAVPGSGRATGSRVLSVRSGLDAEDRPEERRRRVVPLVVLGVVLALAAAFHGWNLAMAPPKQPPATFEGAPPGTMAVQNGKAYFLISLPGHKVNGADLEAYRQREARRGNNVREVSPGTWIVEPAETGEGRTP